MIRLFLGLALLCAFAGGAQAQTRRVAVVVGNNVGSGARPPLRFAEEDAAKMAGVLSELGGIAPQDLFLVRGQSLAALRSTLQRADATIAQRKAAGQVVVLFYFSGHSDGQSLELGTDRWSFAELRQWLRNTGADVRLAFVDSCRSGGLLALKGGVPGPTFDISLADNLESSGEVLITSSAADESALESAELRGSFFSHHLLSGLRGAADVSGDGLVTLAEAYQYAFSRTVSTTTNTVIGPQHPNYDYRLSGRGEVVLTRIQRPASVVELPTGFDRILLGEARGGRVIAELGPFARLRVGVAPGPYAIRAWRKGQLLAGEVRVEYGQTAVVAAQDLSPTRGDVHRMKGDAGSESGDGGWSLLWSLGVASSVGDRAGFGPDLLPGVRMGLAKRRGGWMATVSALGVRFSGDGMRESQAHLTIGAGRVFERGRFAGAAGVEVGGGLAWQRSRAGDDRTSGQAALGVFVEGDARVTGHLGLVLSLRAPATVMRLNDATVIRLLPAAWLGARYAW